MNIKWFSFFVFTFSLLVLSFSLVPPARAACSPPSDYSSCIDQHPDYNPRVRGWETITGGLGLIPFQHRTDPAAPQLSTLIEGNTRPKISSLFQVYDWNWATNSRGPLYPRPADLPSSYDFTTIVGLAISSGQNILTPDSGYDIGGGNEATILFATNNQVTLKYGVEDTFSGSGYGLHLLDLNVDSDLLSCYNKYNSAGRKELPVLSSGEIIGTGSGSDVLVLVRDSGQFMDPRWLYDWWQQNTPKVGHKFTCRTVSVTKTPPSGPSCTATSSDSSSRPFECATCQKEIPFPIASCAETPTINGQVRYYWNDGGNSCNNQDYVRKTWNGTVTVDSTSTQIPFVGKKGEESEKQYLADYFEGTAFYYAPPYDFTKTADQQRVLNEGGVWRKLAPRKIQDQYKRDMVNRAQKSLSGQATNPIHNYTVAYKGREAKLTDFLSHFPPEEPTPPSQGASLDEIKNYNQQYTKWQTDYDNWQKSDWGILWQAVPMFSKEDSPGKINISLQSPYDKFEITSDPKNQDIQVPHVARLFEAATAVKNLLSPSSTGQQTFLPSPANLSSSSNSYNLPILLASADVKGSSPNLLAQSSQPEGIRLEIDASFQPASNQVFVSGKLYSVGGCDGHFKFLVNNAPGFNDQCCLRYNTPGFDPYSIESQWTKSPYALTPNVPMTVNYFAQLTSWPRESCREKSSNVSCTFLVDSSGKFTTNCGGGPPPPPACGTNKSSVSMCKDDTAISGPGDSLCCKEVNASFIATDLIPNNKLKPPGCLTGLESACYKTEAVDRKLQISLELPLLGEIWNKTAAAEGVFSLFRPEELGAFKSTQAKDRIRYSASGGDVTGIDPGEADFYYPYLGGIQEAKEWITNCILNPSAQSALCKTTSALANNVSLGPVPNSLSELFLQIGQATGVPPKILEAVMRIEGPQTFSYSDDQIRQYSTPGVTIPGCGPNECSATGPMQMTTGVDNKGSASCLGCCFQGSCQTSCPNQWATYGQGNVCNLRDNVYAAARKIKHDSGATSGDSWNQTQVYQAARSYYGNCTVPYARLGNRTYCEFVWWYYNNQHDQ